MKAPVRSFLVFVVLMVAIVAFVGVATAAVTVNSRTGTVSITAAGGAAAIVEKGQALPAIASGSEIKVESGDADIQVSAGSTLKIKVNGDVIVLDGTDRVSITVTLEGVTTVHVLEGPVDVLNSLGEKVASLGKGETQTYQPEPKAEVSTQAQAPVYDPTSLSSAQR